MREVYCLELGRWEGGMNDMPMQPIIWVGDVIRFQENRIVRKLLDEGGINLNHIACWDVSCEERAQFAQLIGYSVSGFGDLGYASDEVVEDADSQAEAMVEFKAAIMQLGSSND